jgi:hypothetical protein
MQLVKLPVPRCFCEAPCARCFYALLLPSFACNICDFSPSYMLQALRLTANASVSNALSCHALACYLTPITGPQPSAHRENKLPVPVRINILFPHSPVLALTSHKTDDNMSLSGPRLTLSSFTITANRADTNDLAQMSVQHIVKDKAAEKVSDAILVTDPDMIKFIIILMMDIQYDLGSDQIEYWQPDRGITVVPALQERVWQTAINNMYNRLSQTGQTEIKFTVRSLSTLSSQEHPPKITTFDVPSSNCESSNSEFHRPSTCYARKQLTE